MHELFLTSSVHPDDFETACAILQGLTWMTARRSVYRTLYFAGLPHPNGLPKQPTRTNLTRQQDRQLWLDLNKQLLRSSYVLQATFEVSPENDFGKEGPMDLGRMPATLRWTDLPEVLKDPQAVVRKKNAMRPSDQPEPVKDSPIISRKKIEIPFSAGLPSLLSENQQRYTSEIIQECYSFRRGDLEIVLSRYYHLPTAAASNGHHHHHHPIPQLPKWDELRPVDPAQKWILNIKLNVTEDSQPEKISKANEELMRNKIEFEKLFRFEVIDRRVFDTRIAPPPINPGIAPP
ncbi:mediator complex, subunit Med18 [Poronia punctata]|nr:mediator complex, subunit Med18 [Poronia punctata]